MMIWNCFSHSNDSKYYYYQNDFHHHCFYYYHRWVIAYTISFLLNINSDNFHKIDNCRTALKIVHIGIMFTLCYSVMVLSIVELPPCHMYGILHLLSDLLRLNCYTDWIVCSSEINILGIILWPDCRNHCTYQGYSRGTCNPLTNVGCPCIPPGNKKCQCYN